MLPSKGWVTYEAVIRSIGERRDTPSSPDIAVLRALGLVEKSDPLALSAEGLSYFDAQFIRRTEEDALQVLRGCLMEVPPVLAIVQLLDGVAGANRDAVEAVLRSQGFGEGLTDRHIGSLLALMNRCGVVDYVRMRGEVRVLVHPAQLVQPPTSIFISPQTPFGNRVWLRRVLQEAEGHIHWLDKHFVPGAFEAIWEAASGSTISEVLVLSLYLEEYHAGKKVKRDFGNLAQELGARGVRLEWRVIESREIRDTHDRWIVSRNAARNVPNVNAILSGQHSEMNVSDQRAELDKLFGGYWARAIPIDSKWS